MSTKAGFLPKGEYIFRFKESMLKYKSIKTKQITFREATIKEKQYWYEGYEVGQWGLRMAGFKSWMKYKGDI